MSKKRAGLGVQAAAEQRHAADVANRGPNRPGWLAEASSGEPGALAPLRS